MADMPPPQRERRGRIDFFPFSQVFSFSVMLFRQPGVRSRLLGDDFQPASKKSTNCAKYYYHTISDN
jgi:hypothetical protein